MNGCSKASGSGASGIGIHAYQEVGKRSSLLPRGREAERREAEFPPTKVGNWSSLLPKASGSGVPSYQGREAEFTPTESVGKRSSLLPRSGSGIHAYQEVGKQSVGKRNSRLPRGRELEFPPTESVGKRNLRLQCVNGFLTQCFIIS